MHRFSTNITIKNVNQLRRTLTTLALLCLAQTSYAGWSANQLKALQSIFEWVQDPDRGGGRLPATRKITSDVFPFGFERLTGAGHYREGHPQHHLAIFSSMEDFWLNFREFALRRGLSISLLNMPWHSPSDTLLAILQQEALELVFNWMQGHPGRIPDRKCFGFKTKSQIPVEYERLTHTGMYAGLYTSIFTSTHEFWRRQQEYCRERGLIFHLIDIRLQGEFDAQTKAILQDEALERVFSWIKCHGGRLPEAKSFGLKAGKIAVGYPRLVGTSDYAPGGRLAHGALFAGPQDFWVRLKAYAQARGFSIHLLNVTFAGELGPALRAILQQEASEIIASWQEQHRRTPKKSDFGYGQGQIPLLYPRLVSVGLYGRGNGPYRSGIFRDLSELQKHYRKYNDPPTSASQSKFTKPTPSNLVERVGSQTNVPLKKTIVTKRPDKPKEVSASKSVQPEPPSDDKSKEPAKISPLQEQILQQCLEWMRDPDRGNTRFPQRENFGPKPDQIPLNINRLISPQGQEGQAPFSSFQDFALKMKLFARQQNHQINLIYVPMHSPLTPIMRKVIQKEALTMIYTIMVRADLKRLPVRSDFRKSGGPIPLDYDRLIGSGIYLYDTIKESRIFDSMEDFESAYLRYVDETRSGEHMSCTNLLSNQNPEVS